MIRFLTTCIIKNSKEIVDEIKVLSWKWSVHQMKPCLFSGQTSILTSFFLLHERKIELQS
jgi:hypothetical protein